MTAFPRGIEFDWARVALRFVINVIALLIADALVPGIAITGWQSYAVMALVLGLINTFAKPFLTLLSCPLILLTLGLFLLVLNAALLGLSAWISGRLGFDVRVESFGAALFGAIIMSIVAWMLSLVFD